MNSNKKVRTYSAYASEAAALLSKQIQLARKRRGYTERNFAERIGISLTTLRKIEKGNLKCELGLVLEAAAIVGVNLFNIDPQDSRMSTAFSIPLESVNDKLSLLPKQVRKRTSGLDDAF